MGRVDYSIEFNISKFEFNTDYFKKKIRKEMKIRMQSLYGNEMGPQGDQTVDFEYTLDIDLRRGLDSLHSWHQLTSWQFLCKVYHVTTYPGDYFVLRGSVTGPVN